MTGFGKAAEDIGKRRVIVEIRSLNSKGLDLSTRLPGFLREKELEIRKLISSSAVRGKVDVSIYLEDLDLSASHSINHDLLAFYLKELKKAEYNLDIRAGEYLPILMKMPDIFKQEKEDLNENDWQAIERTIEKALDHFADFRRQEGVAMEQEITASIKKIEDLREAVVPFENERITLLRNRINRNLEESLKEKADMNRLEQEMIHYLEKLDITEEHVRLKNHCDYFMDTIDQAENLASFARKLDVRSIQWARRRTTARFSNW